MFGSKTLVEESRFRGEIEDTVKELVNRINEELHETLLLSYSGGSEDECNKRAFSRMMKLCSFMEDEASRVRRSIEAKLGRINPDLLERMFCKGRNKSHDS